MGKKTGRGQSGGVIISGRVGSVGGDIVGRDKITYSQIAEEQIAALEAHRVIQTAGLERQKIVRLAQRLNPDAQLDFDQAVRELERTVAKSLEGTTPPEVERLREEARAATERGASDEADDLLRRIRDIIDAGAAKAVLILGRFTPERKAVLDTLRSELRSRGYAPMLFDFERPEGRTVDETVTLLARVARFVIADISDAKSVLQELRAIVPDIPSVPVQPIIVSKQEEPGMFDFFHGFRSVLKVHRYDTLEQLVAGLDEGVIRPAETKVLELQRPKAQQ